MNEVNIIFANKLMELRKAANYKQDYVARQLKFSQQHYSKLEKGKINFTPKLITEICKLFDITIQNFLNSGNQFNFTNSPQSNTNNSFNNDIKIMEELVKAKDEIIKGQKTVIDLLQKSDKKK